MVYKENKNTKLSKSERKTVLLTYAGFIGAAVDDRSPVLLRAVVVETVVRRRFGDTGAILLCHSVPL